MDKRSAGRQYYEQYKRPFRERERPDRRDCNTGGNPGVFSLIRQLSETVVLPIAGLVLTFVMCYELIQMLIDRNNLHDIDTWIFFKWIFKTFVVVINIVVFVIVYGRMIEIYLLTSLTPVPMATLVNREIGGMGQNYMKSLCAVGFQGLQILECVGI